MCCENNAINNAIDLFKENDKKYPKQIVLFRDGVGDGQLLYAIEHEVSQLLSAFKCIDSTYEPQFTMVVVQKRINTRFFMQSVSVKTNDTYFSSTN